MKMLKIVCSFLILLIFIECQHKSDSDLNTISDYSEENKVDLVRWHEVDTIDVMAFNSDIASGKRTIDVGVYFPSNFDSKFDKVTLSRMLNSLKSAKEIYEPTGVQINLLWVKTGIVNPKYFSIQSNEVPGIPATEYVNMYVHMQRHPSKITKLSLDAFTSIVEPNKHNKRTIYLIALQDVFYPFLAVSEGRNWTMKTVRTGGLSFPSYIYGNNLPENLRGVITITNLQRPDRLRSTIAHEIGHKAMNVSHEYKSTNPGHEVYADGGLMLYGDGEDIPAGKEGRWHQERLLLSPFIYRMDENGNKKWNEDYKESGHYYDPLYGDKVIYFDAKPEINKDW